MAIRRGHRITLAAGVYQDASGITARVQKGKSGRAPLVLEERYALGTPLKEIVAWQERARATLGTLKDRDAAGRGTFAADVVEYLASAPITKLCKKRRTQQLAWWVDHFGHLRRINIKAPAIAKALNELAASGASGSTLNKYRTALFHLWTVLDGKDAPNPVRNVPPRQNAKALPRGLNYEVVQTILAHVRSKFGRPGDLTAARIQVLAYAPVTPEQLMQLTARDVDFAAATVLVHGRDKGAGAPAQLKPLMTQAVEAFRALDAAGGLVLDRGVFRPGQAYVRGDGVTCGGSFWIAQAATTAKPGNGAPWRLAGGTAGLRFSTSSVRKAFIRARNAAQTELRKVDPTVDLSTVRLYDLRHSYAALIYAATGSLSVTGQMLDHQNAKTTQRYALSAVPAHLQAARDAAQKLLAALPAAPPSVVPVRARNLKLVRRAGGQR